MLGVEDSIDREIIPGSFARSLITIAQLGGKNGGGGGLLQISPIVVVIVNNVKISEGGKKLQRNNRAEK